jgi:chromosome segregation ATPase
MNHEPKYSCPFLDEAIEHADAAANGVRDAVEKARAIHEQLRERGREWEKEAERLEKLLGEEEEARDSAEQSLAQAEAEIKERDSQIMILERSLAQAEAELREALSR